jgi:hypothetical protein
MFNMPVVNYCGKIDDTYSGNNGTKFENEANQSVLPCKRTPVYQFCTPGYQLPRKNSKCGRKCIIYSY